VKSKLFEQDHCFWGSWALGKVVWRATCTVHAKRTKHR